MTPACRCRAKRKARADGVLALPKLKQKLPTGALATLVVGSDSWAALRPGDAELVDYVVPGQLG